MAKYLNCILAYGVRVPEFVDSGGTLVEKAEDALSELHGNPGFFRGYHHLRPQLDAFESREEWLKEFQKQKNNWYKNDPEGQRRKALDAELSSLTIDVVFAGYEASNTEFLVDETTQIRTGSQALEIEQWPETPANFHEQLERLFDLAGVEYRIKQAPRWWLLGNYW